MAVSVRQSTWKMVGANTERGFRTLEIPEKHTLSFSQSIHAEGPMAGGPTNIPTHHTYFEFLEVLVRVAKSPEFR